MLCHLFLDESDIRGDIMFKTDVTQALLMLILSKSPANVLKNASKPTYLKQSSNIRDSCNKVCNPKQKNNNFIPYYFLT